MWTTLATGSGTINSITFTGTSNAGAVSAIEVDGQILVDGGLGNNGFFLPFDPAQTGANYSSITTASGDFESNVSGSNTAGFKAAYVWDGKVAAGSQTGITTKLAGSTFTLTFGSAIAIDEIWYSAVDGSSTLTTDNGTITLPIAAGTTKTLPLGTAAGSTTSVSVTGNAASIFGFISNGSLLVDHSSIAVDMSGNENHFYDQNFITDETSNSSQVWSANSTLGDNPPGMFDGIIAKANPNRTTFNPSAGTYYTIMDSVSVASTQGISINYQSIGTAAQVTLKVNGSTEILSDNLTSPLTGWGIVAPFTGTINKLEIKFASGSGSSSIAAIAVDNKILVDSNGGPGIDTVIDTPMKNYAVLEKSNAGLSLTNGNLKGYYNLLDQQYMYSSIGISSKNYFEVAIQEPGDYWRVGLTSNPSGGWASGYLYGLDGQYIAEGGGSVDTGTTYTNGDIVGVAFDPDSLTVTFYKNGAQAHQTTVPAGSYYGACASGNASGTYAVNFGQQPFVHTPPAGYEGLYQTWAEYARTALGYALDRITQLEKLRLADAVTIADLRTQIAGALSRIASIESDEVNDDAVDNALITLVGNVSAQVTAWSTRIEAAELAITDYGNRITTLES